MKASLHSLAALAFITGLLHAQNPSEGLIEPVTEAAAGQEPAPPVSLDPPPSLPAPGRRLLPEAVPAPGAEPPPATPATPAAAGDGAAAEPAPQQEMQKSDEGYIIKDAPINDVFQFLAKSAGRQYFHNSKIVGPDFNVTGHLNDGDPLQQMEELAFMYRAFPAHQGQHHLRPHPGPARPTAGRGVPLSAPLPPPHRHQADPGTDQADAQPRHRHRQLRAEDQHHHHHRLRPPHRTGPRVPPRRRPRQGPDHRRNENPADQQRRRRTNRHQLVLHPWQGRHDHEGGLAISTRSSVCPPRPSPTSPGSDQDQSRTQPDPA